MIHAPAAAARRSVWSRLDLVLIVSAAALLGMGLMALFSADPGIFKRHMLRLAVGVAPFSLFLFVKPAWWLRVAKPLYVLNLVLLALVLFAGSRGGGAQRWVAIGPLEFQPSEMSKILTVLTLAAYFVARQREPGGVATFLGSLLHIVPPVALVFLQPHLGGALVIFAIWAGLCVYAGVRWSYLAATVLAVVAGLVFALTVPGILRDYHKERVRAMFVSDEKGADYQQLRAAIAFGSGGVVGTGYRKGEQKAGKFIPAQHTDFVSTIVGEEAGLVGMTLMLAAFSAFFYRGWQIAVRAPGLGERLMAVGVLCTLGFHTLVNLGMNLQLLPVVGLWLPFLSYGGTALWLTLACVGLLLRLSADQRAGLGAA